MIDLSRHGLLAGLGAALVGVAAPAIVRPQNIMRVRKVTWAEPTASVAVGWMVNAVATHFPGTNAVIELVEVVGSADLAEAISARKIGRHDIINADIYLPAPSETIDVGGKVVLESLASPARAKLIVPAFVAESLDLGRLVDFEKWWEK